MKAYGKLWPHKLLNWKYYYHATLQNKSDGKPLNQPAAELSSPYFGNFFFPVIYVSTSTAFAKAIKYLICT